MWPLHKSGGVCAHVCTVHTSVFLSHDTCTSTYSVLTSRYQSCASVLTVGWNKPHDYIFLYFPFIFLIIIPCVSHILGVQVTLWLSWLPMLLCCVSVTCRGRRNICVSRIVAMVTGCVLYKVHAKAWKMFEHWACNTTWQHSSNNVYCLVCFKS